jgi:hypothetical protein
MRLSVSSWMPAKGRGRRSTRDRLAVLLREAEQEVREGRVANPDPNQVFLVFVNDEGVAYNWRWEAADMESGNFPKAHETRFKKTVYHAGNDER